MTALAPIEQFRIAYILEWAGRQQLAGTEAAIQVAIDCLTECYGDAELACQLAEEALLVLAELAAA